MRRFIKPAIPKIIKHCSRRFPPPWSAELMPNCFILRDADGQALATPYLYVVDLCRVG
jgi:hypothetical protein